MEKLKTKIILNYYIFLWKREKEESLVTEKALGFQW